MQSPGTDRDAVLQRVPESTFTLRQALIDHFDVIVVIWALTLVIAWSLISLGRADLSNDQWSAPQQHGPAWMVPGEGA